MLMYKTHIQDAYLIPSKKYHDHRGYFRILSNFPFSKPDQENLSFNKKGVFRGLHAQKYPYAQSKLVSVISGSVLDWIIDMDPGSPTFKKVQRFRLSEKNGFSLLIPKTCFHGFLALEDTFFQYHVWGEYKPEYETGINPSFLFQDLEGVIINSRDSSFLSLDEHLDSL